MKADTKLVAPVTYQGGKQRIAGKILDIINPLPNTFFYDLCCGSGAVSIELINRGFPVSMIKMLDAGPWGIFWESISKRTFSVDKFRKICGEIPSDLKEVRGFMEKASERPVNEDAKYWYLLLQAAAFGGKAIWIKDGKWQNCTFRSYWLPTATSNRRSPVNPMMPMPSTLISRVERIVEEMKDVKAANFDINRAKLQEGVVYVDPPYSKTTKYGFDFDVVGFATRQSLKIFVSEGKPLSERSYLISSGMKKGGISGERSKEHEEWLSEFN